MENNRNCVLSEVISLLNKEYENHNVNAKKYNKTTLTRFAGMVEEERALLILQLIDEIAAMMDD